MVGYHSLSVSLGYSSSYRNCLPCSFLYLLKTSKYKVIYIGITHDAVLIRRGCINLYSFSMFTYLFANFARRTTTLTEKEPLRGVDYQTLTNRIREKQQHIPAIKQAGQ